MPIRKISAELISEICGSMRSLSVLNLSHNEISAIEHLEQLRTLTKLDLSHNRISSISGLAPLSQLVVLSAQLGHLVEPLGEILRLGGRRHAQRFGVRFGIGARAAARRARGGVDGKDGGRAGGGGRDRSARPAQPRAVAERLRRRQRRRRVDVQAERRRLAGVEGASEQTVRLGARRERELRRGDLRGAREAGLRDDVLGPDLGQIGV